MSPRTIATLSQYKRHMARHYAASALAWRTIGAHAYCYNEESYGPLPCALTMYRTGMPASAVWAYGFGI